MLDRTKGEQARGIWAKHWQTGMNKGAPIEQLSKIYIAHYLTEAQGQKVIEILSKYYIVIDKDFKADKCIMIQEK